MKVILAFLLCLFATCEVPAVELTSVINLAGDWKVRLDPLAEYAP
jgi:hypothetical protein